VARTAARLPAAAAGGATSDTRPGISTGIGGGAIATRATIGCHDDGRLRDRHGRRDPRAADRGTICPTSREGMIEGAIAAAIERDGRSEASASRAHRGTVAATGDGFAATGGSTGFAATIGGGAVKALRNDGVLAAVIGIASNIGVAAVTVAVMIGCVPFAGRFGASSSDT